mmetsp:Transcript_29219/g.44143  ORF Transcript_29219/g.44143 Transcript_29219/m.44143 type:complete len:261 (+) Transcript_29219:58-840(+)
MKLPNVRGAKAPLLCVFSVFCLAVQQCEAVLRAKLEAKLSAAAGVSVPSPGDEPASGTSCFEGRILDSNLAERASHFLELKGLYASLADDCRSGTHSLDCVSNAQFADKPAQWMELCDQKMGAQSAYTAAVCVAASHIGEQVKAKAAGFETLHSIVNAHLNHCDRVPMACFVQAEQCLFEADITYCFNTCVRQGRMPTPMRPTTTTPTTTPASTSKGETTTTGAVTTTKTTTTTMAWWETLMDSMASGIKTGASSVSGIR